MKRNRNASRRRLRVFAPEQLESRTLLNGGGWSAALDFGVEHSPVEPGFRQVLPLAYSASEGLGWVNPKAIFGLDRGNSDALRRDGHQGSRNTFLVDMPNGLYDITPTIGRISGAVDQISVRAEGQLVASDLATSSGEFVEPTFRLPVQDGQLALELIDEGGLTNSFGIAGLKIQQVMPPNVNLGADLSTDEGTDVFFKGTVTGSAPFTYAWDFGDGTVRTGSAEATHSYKDNGVYNAKLSVTDANGLTTVAGLFVTVSNVAPVPSINGPSTGEVGQTISFSASALDAGAADVEAGFSFHWDFGDGTKGAGAQAQHAYATPGTYSVKLTATDKDGGSATTTWETTIQGQENTPPLLVPTGDQTIAEGQQLVLVVTAYDWDVPAQQLRFSLIGPPEGASINPVSGVFSWTPTEAQGPGSYMFGIRVSDGQLSDEETITVTVTEVNTAPSLAPIPNQTFAEGTKLSITAVGTDPDLPAQRLTYSLVTGPEGSTIDPVSGVFRWTPTEAQGPGSFPVKIRVSDGILWAEQSFTATVTEVNTPPVLAAISNRSINEGSTLTLTASATDVDLPKQTLTYSLVNPPSGAKINSSTGAFTWKPTETQGPGTFTITVQVSDGIATDQKSFTVTVNEVNVAPVIAAISNQTVVEGNLLTLTVSASDADVPKQTLNYWLASPPAGAAINSSTGVFTWRPTEAQGPGSYTINVRVSDGLLTAQRSFTVSVTEFNSAPTLASISNQTIEQGRQLKLTAIGSDPDLPAQTLTYSLVTAPTGASIDPATGIFTWTPTTSQGPSSFPVTVRVSDGSLSADQSFSVTVTRPNTPPTLQAIPDQTVAEGTQLTVTAVATDADLPAQTLTYSLLNPMDGAIFDTTTGVLTWTPTESQGPGSFSVTIQVSDGFLTDSQSFTITVTEVNSAPVLAPISNRTVTAGSPLTFTATATDPDLPAQVLTYSLQNAPAGAAMNPSTGLFSWTPTLAQVATFTLSVLVSDGQLTDVKSFAITVTPPAPSNTIYIGQSWLASRGAGPYLLDRADTTYILQTDVTVEGTAFIVLNKNVTFDLNGHTVTYGNSAPITVPNGGFEEGSSPTDIPGWTFSDPSVVSRQTARTGMWGNWMLRLNNIATTQTLTSHSIAIPKASVEYAAAVTPRGPSGTVVRLSVIDTVTGTILAAGNARDPNRGFSAVVPFSPATTNPVQLRIEVTPPSGKSATVDLDYASLERSRDYGVVASPSNYFLPTHLQTPEVVANSRYAGAFTLKGGTIQQGSGRSFGGSPVRATSLPGLVIENMTLIASGMDTHHVDAQWVSTPVIHGNHLIGQLDRISDRMRLFAGLNLSGVGGVVVVEGNELVGKMHTGITLTRTGVVTDQASIRNNSIRHDTLGTDGYGMVLNNVKNFVIAGNSIQPVNGRGILFDGFSGGRNEHGLIQDNIVEARERANLEYDGNGMEATALRIRNYSGTSSNRNLRFVGNTFFAETGVGGVWAAAAARIGTNNDTGQMNGANLRFEANTFRARLNSIDPSYTGARLPRAWALTLGSLQPGVGLVFDGNRLVSNDVSLNLGDNDSYNGLIEGDGGNGVEFLNTTYVRLQEGASMPHRSLVLGDWGNTVRGVRSIGSLYEDGATPQIHFTGSKVKDIATGWLLNLTVTNPDGSAVPGATVNLFDRENGAVFQGTTDENGQITGMRVVTQVQSQTTTNPSLITTDPRGPFTIEVVSGTRRKITTLELTSNRDFSIVLD